MQEGVSGCVHEGLWQEGNGVCMRVLCTCKVAAGASEHAPRQGQEG